MKKINFEYANKIIDLIFKILILLFISILLVSLSLSMFKGRMIISGLSITGISSVYLLYMRYKLIESAPTNSITEKVLQSTISLKGQNGGK